MNGNTLTMLNTRPSPMGEGLQQLLQPIDVHSLFSPTIHNIPLTDNNSVLLPDSEQLLAWFNDKTVAWIFVSRPTVTFFSRLLTKLNIEQFVPSGNIFAIGDSTKAELQLCLQTPSEKIITPQKSDSESFLQLNALDNFKTFIHIKGKGGRELISQTLQQANKQTINLELYQRKYVQYAKNEVKSWLACDLVLATSIDIAQSVLTNLAEHLTAEELQLFLTKIKWIVFSDRIKQFLITNNASKQLIFICERSDNSSIINTINLISK